MTAVKAAGLVDTLKGAGPFTVFAPTDEAFAKVPKETLDALLADKEKLTAVLTYHVVPGLVMSKDVSAGKVGSTERGRCGRWVVWSASVSGCTIGMCIRAGVGVNAMGMAECGGIWRIHSRDDSWRLHAGAWK